MEAEKDPWKYLFDQGEKVRPSDKDDIIPYWIFELGKGKGVKIERHVPCMPLSRDVERLRDLKQSLVMYRMVFGQPRQEDLLNFLRSRLSGDVKVEDVLKYRIDLTPR